jgi:hypothetical protein
VKQERKGALLRLTNAEQPPSRFAPAPAGLSVEIELHRAIAAGEVKPKAPIPTANSETAMTIGSLNSYSLTWRGNERLGWQWLHESASVNRSFWERLFCCIIPSDGRPQAALD